VPTERLGVRVSIIERVAGAGGSARIDSTRGSGTIVTVRWPAPESERERPLYSDTVDTDLDDEGFAAGSRSEVAT
jgi:hypothetical protein